MLKVIFNLAILGTVAGCIVLCVPDKWKVALIIVLLLINFIGYYHIIRRLWVTYLYVAVLYQYENGERFPIWEGWYASPSIARRAAQLQRSQVEHQTGNCNYCFEVEEKEI